MVARREFLAAGAAVLAGAAGCATRATLPTPAVAPSAPQVRVGDRWRYVRINLYNGIEVGTSTMQVADLAPRLRVTVTDADRNAHADEVYSQAWQVLQEPSYDQVLQFASPCPMLPSRLEPGASEQYRGRYSVPDLYGRFFWSAWLDARNWERITVPAGSFDVLRVERRIAFQHTDSFRIDSTRTETLWYSPLVNRWVRREWTGSYRLPGFPPIRNREDWIAWELLEHVPAATR